MTRQEVASEIQNLDVLIGKDGTREASQYATTTIQFTDITTRIVTEA